MSAPPLPDTFGNYALGEFVEVVSPADISWLPQTTGWVFLGVIILLLVARLGWIRALHWHRNRYRREADSRLKALSPDNLGERLIAEINKLLKLAAMAAYGREKVAHLYGEEWAAFLNQQCAAQSFTPEQAGMLATAVYRPVKLETQTAKALLDASLYWVRNHRENTDV